MRLDFLQMKSGQPESPNLHCFSNGAAHNQLINLDSRLSYANWNALARLSASSAAVVQRQIIANHAYYLQRLRT